MAYEFDFQNYVDRKKTPGGGHEARGGFGDYAFSGDLRVLRRLERLAPVRVVVESTVRFWKSFRKNELLGTSVKVSSRQFPHLHARVVECAEMLDIPTPTVYVTESPHVNAGTFGTNEEAFIIVNSALVDKLDVAEVKFVIGHECGHIQNNHVVYHTAARFMAQGIGVYVKWASLPASMALDAWSRRGEVTCDRAGLICCKDEEVALKSIMKLAVGSEKLFDEMNLDEFLGQLEGVQEGFGRFAELFQSHPYLPKRVKAIKLFAESAYYRNLVGEREGGRALDEIDREVEEVIQVL
jgi:Zn-dependent protease with chaperone function